jgi:hypothetical protein
MRRVEHEQDAPSVGDREPGEQRGRLAVLAPSAVDGEAAVLEERDADTGTAAACGGAGVSPRIRRDPFETAERGAERERELRSRPKPGVGWHSRDDLDRVAVLETEACHES